VAGERARAALAFGDEAGPAPARRSVVSYFAAFTPTPGIRAAARAWRESFDRPPPLVVDLWDRVTHERHTPLDDVRSGEAGSSRLHCSRCTPWPTRRAA